MLSGRTREFAKRLLSKSRVKLVYNRITHTRFTTLYFFSALFSCLVLCSLQAVLLFDNTNAVNILANVVDQADVPPHITMFMDDHIQVCDHIPEHVKDTCSIVIDLDDSAQSTAPVVGNPLDRRDDHDDDSYDHTASLVSESTPNSTGSISLNSTVASPYPLSCVYSLSWLEEVLHDSQREDVATLFYQVWLFTLGLVAILNESLPHLGAAIFGHILGGAWSASRIESTRTLLAIYRKSIVPGPCEGTDLLGSWWELRLVHSIPVVAANGVAILALGFLSWKLFGVYHKQTLSRVGASPVIHNVYKLVLFFSVGLQLASFFIVVSTAIWAAKVGQGSFKALSNHHYMYVVTFVFVFVLAGPWLLLGWICVRRECKTRFWIFMAISAVLLAVSSVMFSLKLYRCIFMTWQFFATLTVTAFAFLVITTVLGIACYLNYGKGLAHYLQVTEALEGEDFTPVYFPRLDDPQPSKLVRQYTSDSWQDIEKAEKTDDLTNNQPTLEYSPPAPPTPKSKTTTKAAFNLKTQPIPRPRPTLAFTARGKRGDSVYSDKLDSPIILSSSPPLISDMASPSPSMAKRMTRSNTLRKSRAPPSAFTGDGQVQEDSGRVDVKTLVSIQRPSRARISIATTVSGSSMRQTPSPIDEEPEKSITKPTSRALSMRSKTLSPVERVGAPLPSVPTRF